MNSELFDNLKDVFGLATGAAAFINEVSKLKREIKNQDDVEAVISSSGNSAQIGSSGDWAQIGSSGNSAQIGSSGDWAQIGSSGNSARIGSSGNWEQIGSSGNLAQIGSSGNLAQIGSSGNSAQIGSSGDWARIGSSGDWAQIGSSGNLAQIGSSGNLARIGSSGNSARIGSSGNWARIGSSGNSARIGSSGNWAQIDSTGDTSVIAAIGYKSIAKAKAGSWLTLAEYDNNGDVLFVKTEQVDNKKIKEDTYYTLYNKNFQEVQIIDNVPTIVLTRKKDIIKGKFLNDYSDCWIFQKDGMSAHGITLKQAYRDWLFKKTPRDMSEYEGLKLDDIRDINYWAVCYRNITGACSAGTENFIENFKDRLKPEMSLQEVITVTKGQYGSNTFKEFFNK